MTELVEEISEWIYRAYLADCHTKTMEEIWEFALATPLIKMFRGGDKQLVKITKGDVVYFNVNFIKVIYISIMEKLLKEYKFETEEIGNTHKNQIWVYIIFCFYSDEI
jgi:hypothetical protein